MGASVGTDRKYLVNYDTVKQIDKNNAKILDGQRQSWHNDIDARLRDDVKSIIGFGIHRASRTYIMCRECHGRMIELPGLLCPSCQRKKLISAIKWRGKCLIQRLLTPFNAG